MSKLKDLKLLNEIIQAGHSGYKNPHRNGTKASVMFRQQIERLRYAGFLIICKKKRSHSVYVYNHYYRELMGKSKEKFSLKTFILKLFKR
jgi:hypothetical protein